MLELLRPTTKIRNKAKISLILMSVPIASFAANEQDFASDINKASIEYRLPVALLIEIIKQESSFNKKAVSSAGAKGLMQLMDKTAKRYGVQDSFDPAQNIDAGARYLRGLIDRYNSARLALAAYNAGEAAVDQYKGVPPFKETKGYIARIAAGYKRRTGRDLVR